MDPIITTLLTAPAILALVTIGRDLGLPAKLAPVVAVVLGIGLGVAEQQLGHLPIYQAAVQGALIGLAASGVYDVSKLAGGRLVPSPDVPTVDTSVPIAPAAPAEVTAPEGVDYAPPAARA